MTKVITIPIAVVQSYIFIFFLDSQNRNEGFIQN